MRPTKATVHLSAIAHNLQVAQELAPRSKIIAVIKANAYGHGAIEVARSLEASVPAFAVAFIDEAVQLRDAGISQPILILQGTTTEADVTEAAAKDFWLMIHSGQQLDRVLHAKIPAPVRVWIKTDSGMHRLGLRTQQLDKAINDLRSSRNVHKDMVLCSHLACADEADNAMTLRQVKHTRNLARKYGLPLSIANSAGILRWPDSHADWNRPGYMLYGNTPVVSEIHTQVGLMPAMNLQSEVISIGDIDVGDGVGYGQNWIAKKPSKIGTIPIGYADGYPRHAPNGTPVLVNGQRVPLVGRVSMDMISVDLSELEQARVGDPVELWGENLGVNEVAERAGTIGYELLAGLTGRIPVTYIQ